MAYAVTLCLDDSAARGIADVWQRLADAGISDSMVTLGYRPHLTLAIADRADPAATVAVLKEFAERTPSLPVPDRMMPMAFSPWSSASERKNTSIGRLSPRA